MPETPARPFILDISEDGARVRIHLSDPEMDVATAEVLMQHLQAVLQEARRPIAESTALALVEFVPKKLRCRYVDQSVMFTFELSDREHVYRIPLRLAEDLAMGILRAIGRSPAGHGPSRVN